MPEINEGGVRSPEKESNYDLRQVAEMLTKLNEAGEKLSQTSSQIKEKMDALKAAGKLDASKLGARAEQIAQDMGSVEGNLEYFIAELDSMNE